MKRHSFINITLLIIFLTNSCEKKENQDFNKAISKLKNEKLDQIDLAQEKLPFLTIKNLDPIWEEDNKSIIKIPDFLFQNQNGDSINQEKLKGKITISCFFYTKCSGICPHVMRNMRKIKTEFENEPDIYFLSFSVTPDIDTVDTLNRFAKNTGFGKKNWDLLTGSKVEIYKLARETFNADTDTNEKKSQDDFIHSEQIYIIDSKLRIRSIYNGNVNGDIERIINDIRKLKKFG